MQEIIKQGLFYICALIWSLLLLGGLLLFLLIYAASKPARAAEVQFPVSIPMECHPLAEREGHSTTIENKTQLLKARARLWVMKRSDPLVAQCREAVALIRKAQR